MHGPGLGYQKGGGMGDEKTQNFKMTICLKSILFKKIHKNICSANFYAFSLKNGL